MQPQFDGCYDSAVTENGDTVKATAIDQRHRTYNPKTGIVRYGDMPETWAQVVCGDTVTADDNGTRHTVTAVIEGSQVHLDGNATPVPIANLTLVCTNEIPARRQINPKMIWP